MTVQALRSILAIFIVSLLMACAAPVSIKAYDGQRLPAENTSLLMADRQIFVSDVAGYKTGITLGSKAESMEGTQFEIRPGLQKIRFQFFSQSASSDSVGLPLAGTTVTTTHTAVVTFRPIEIAYDFEKGHKYELHYRLDGNKVSARIVDVTKGGTKRDHGAAWGHIKS